ncbi:MAG: WD40 repeat domain-containing protein [Chloroflexota bacterium]|nr:WD40 repeat domain-containing protein [Chloroflexota bacterium]
MTGYSVTLMVGLGLIVVGIIVLFFLPQRQGGMVKAFTVEVDAPGAGVVLIVVGLAAMAWAAPQVPQLAAFAGSTAPTQTATPATTVATGRPTPDPGTGGQPSLCATAQPIALHCALVRPLTGHADAVWSLSFARDGTRLLSSGYKDPPAIVWNVLDGSVITRYRGQVGDIVAAAWSPSDPNLAATGAWDGTIRLWDVNRGTETWRAPENHTGLVRSIGWDSTGRRLASAGDDARVVIWEPGADSPERLVFHLNGQTPYALAWKPSNELGQTVAAGIGDGRLMLWDAETGGESSIPAASTAVHALAWTPDANQIALGSDDGTVRLWNDRLGVRVLTPSHAKTVYSLAWSPDGELLASGSDDGVVRFWRRTQEGAQPIGELKEDRGGVFALAWGSNELLAIGRQDDPRHEIELVRVTRA